MQSCFAHRDADEGGGVTRYYYDRISRVSQTTDPRLKTVRYEYNNKGLRSRLVYPDNTSIYYYYDALGRLAKIKNNSGNTLVAYQYDALSRKVFVSYGNGSYIDYDYDVADHVRKVTNDFGANGSIVYGYTDYDKVGNRKNMIVDGNEHSYDYDKLYQLVNVDYPNETGMSYGYDKLGNRTSTINGEVVPYQSNCLNQYGWVLDNDHNNFWYDDNGNMTANGLQFIFPSYDCENRLKDVWVYGGATVIYKYDYLGRLVKRSVVHGTTSKYVYDGDQIIAEYDGSNNLVRKFVYGAGIDEPVCMIVGSSTYYYHYDGLGSVIALSNAGKQIVEQYSYDVFGTPNTTSSVGNPYMFTGRQYDAQSSLYYYRARFYSPVLGRFLQPDPIGYVDGLNLYTYVGNNPLNWIDPFGLQKAGLDPGAIAAALAAIAARAAAVEAAAATLAQALSGLAIAGTAIGGYTAGAYIGQSTGLSDSIAEGLAAGYVWAAEHTSGARRSTYGKHTSSASHSSKRGHKAKSKHGWKSRK